MKNSVYFTPFVDHPLRSVSMEAALLKRETFLHRRGIYAIYIPICNQFKKDPLMHSKRTYLLVGRMRI